MIEAVSSAEHLCAAPACRRHPVDGNLCVGHKAKLGQWLADILDLYATLDAVPSSAIDLNHAHGSVLAAHRSPARMDVLVLRDHRSRERSCDDPDSNHGRGVLEVLGSWARLVREERGLAGPCTYIRGRRVTPPAIGPFCESLWCLHSSCHDLTIQVPVEIPPTVTSERSVLVAHLDWMCAQDWIDETYRDIRAIHGALTTAHGVQRKQSVGLCPTLNGAQECGGKLFTDDDGAVYCHACERVFPHEELRHLGDVLVKNGFVEVFRAEWFTAVPAGTIRRWVSEKRISSEKRGRKLCVNVAEVEAMRDTRHAVTMSACANAG